MSHESHHFPIEPLTRFARQSGARQPVELTCFSFDDKRQLRHDDSSLAYYWPVSQTYASLSTGFETAVYRDDSINEHLDALLASLMHYETTHGTADTRVDLVTWRGMVTKLLTCPYSRKDGFEMNITRLEQTIYMEEYVSPAARAEKQKREGDRRQKLMSYWGVKYESLATIDNVWDETSRQEIEQRDAKVVNTNKQYCSVVRTKLGSVSMILGGEVDCCYDLKPVVQAQEAIDQDDDFHGLRRPAHPLKSDSLVSHYVELKTSKQRTERDSVSFEKFKLLKFWAQSFLLGIPRIIVGYRDDKGILVNEETISTLRIPGMVNKSSAAWDGNICLNFAADVLQFMKKVVLSRPDGSWRIKYLPNSPSIEIYRTEDDGNGFLTTEYINHKMYQNGNNTG